MKKFIGFALLVVLLGGCLLPDKRYQELRSDYILVRGEIVKNWDNIPPKVQSALIRLDKALRMYDKARGGIIKPIASVIKEANVSLKSIKNLKHQLK